MDVIGMRENIFCKKLVSDRSERQRRPLSTEESPGMSVSQIIFK